jgi:hypothetical protein
MHPDPEARTDLAAGSLVMGPELLMATLPRMILTRNEVGLSLANASIVVDSFQRLRDRGMAA